MADKFTNTQVPERTVMMKFKMQKLTSALVMLFFVLISVAGMAQNYSTTNKKAIKKYEDAEELQKEAMRALQTPPYAEMSAVLAKAVELDPNFVEAWLMKAYVEMDADNFDAAKTAFLKAIEIRPGAYPNALFSLGKMEHRHGDFENARKHMRDFTNMTGNPQVKAEAEHYIDMCSFAIEAVANPVPFKPENLGPEINTDRPEYFPCLTADNATILFTRLIEDERVGPGVQEDFYVSTKIGGKWAKSRNISKPINTMTNEGAPTLSPDGGTLIFTSCDDGFGNYGPGRRGLGSCDLFAAFKNGDNWSKPQNLGRPLNTQHWETQPNFSADGRTLYFIRGIKDRQGLQEGDIYVSRLNSRGSWSDPEKLSERINTPGHEASVIIHPDGKTLYFSSDGHVGMGGLDIYMSRLGPDGEWGEPVNLGYPINTQHDENSLLVSADGKLAYFASDREGGFGDLDLYSFELPEKFRPTPVTYMKGTVFDIKTKDPLPGFFELIDVETGEVVIQSVANPGNGQFLVCLPSDRDYVLNVSHRGYMFYSDKFEMTGGSATDPFLKDVPMTPIEVADKDAPGVVLKNVFFETNKWDLKPKSKIELDKLIEFLSINIDLVIELSGHTDDRGDDADNQVLSENRAKAVRQYLIDEGGIDPARLVAVGYGEKRPIASNDTDEGRAKNRRTEYKIIGGI